MAFYVGCYGVDLRSGEVEEVLCVCHGVLCGGVAVDFSGLFVRNLEVGVVGPFGRGLLAAAGKLASLVSCLLPRDWNMLLPPTR